GSSSARHRGGRPARGVSCPGRHSPKRQRQADGPRRGGNLAVVRPPFGGRPWPPSDSALTDFLRVGAARLRIHASYVESWLRQTPAPKPSSAASRSSSATPRTC